MTMKKLLSILLCFALLLPMCLFSGRTAAALGSELWVKEYYKDVFGDSTEDYYLVNRQMFSGTYNNASTDNAPLGAQIVVDFDGVSILLYLDNSTKVKNTTEWDIIWSLQVKTADGSKFSADGVLEKNSDRIRIGLVGAEDIVAALCAKNGRVSFYLELEDQSVINYLFTADCGNFPALFEDEILKQILDEQFQKSSRLFLDSDYLYTHTTALTIGDESYSPAEVNYYYANEYHNMVNKYGDYISLFELDISSGIAGLDTQSCPMLENGTWRDYFLQSAKTNMTQVKALIDYAKAHDISLTEEEIAEVDARIAQLSEYAKTAGYSSTNNLLAANYGNGVTIALVRQASLDTALASKVYNETYDALSFSAGEDVQYSDKTAWLEEITDGYEPVQGITLCCVG